jgi:Putative lumazine-binding
MWPQTIQPQQSDDLAAIHQTALDYAQGWYEGDVERMRRCLHPELAKRRILRDPQTGEEGFRHVSQQLMLDLTQRGGGSEDVPADERYYDISVLDVFGDIAAVKANLNQYVDYLHLVRSQEQWVIVNVLYQLKDGPTSQLSEAS